MMIDKWGKYIVPDECAKAIKLNGGKPIACFRKSYENRFVTVISSLDPSGPKGIRELHVSISATDMNGFVAPTESEIEEAALLCGLSLASAVRTQGKNAVHLWGSAQ